MTRARAIAVAGSLACAACSSSSSERVASKTQPEDEAAARASIVASDVLQHIRMLASDAFEGRAPGTRGEELTVGYLVEQCKAMKLEPGNTDGSFVQRVPLVGFHSEAGGSFRAGARDVTLQRGVDCVLMTRWIEKDVEIDDSEVVFVGYGVVAPEYGWDDYKDVDVRGKTIVMLVNDPQVPDPKDPRALDPTLFKGAAMTYYGRWTYKFEIAAERGAAAAVIVHQTGPAGYPWEVVQSSWGKENFDLELPDKGRSRAGIESWVTLDKAKELCAAGGQDFDALEKEAATRDFRPVSLGATARFRAHNRSRAVASQNVIAKLTGSDKKRDEYVVYTAHWDHLGKDPSVTGDDVWNGAIDNASGCAGLLEIAQAMAKLPVRPRRTVVFLWVTAEEKGLLGSRYYAEHPVYPLERTLCDINMDSLNPWGRTDDVINVGSGMSTLDDVLAREATAAGKTVRPDQDPGKGSYFRSDHFEFAKRGVPGLYADSGSHFVGKPEEWGKERQDQYVAHDYHKPSDEVRPDWDLAGAVEDLKLLFGVGLRLANDEEWPHWNPSSEFRAVREKSLAEARAPAASAVK